MRVPEREDVLPGPFQVFHAHVTDAQRRMQRADEEGGEERKNPHAAPSPARPE